MNHLTANELKKRGVTAVEECMQDDGEVIVSVRGKETYVVMRMEKYVRLRECELDQAVREARADYEAGRTLTESVDAHLKRVADEV